VKEIQLKSRNDMEKTKHKGLKCHIYSNKAEQKYLFWLWQLLQSLK